MNVNDQESQGPVCPTSGSDLAGPAIAEASAIRYPEFDLNRVLFYGHALLAVYCLACGAADSTRCSLGWITPNGTFLGLLWASTVVFPIAGLVAVVCRRPRNGLASLAVQGVASLAQVYGLLPLFC